MKLYDLKAGTNPRRVRIYLAEKDIDIPKVEVNMMEGENKSPDFLAINPMGTMPVLELDDGTIITESIAICRYFELQQPEPPLFGSTPLEQAKVEMWNRRMELELYLPIAHGFRHTNPFWQNRLKQFLDWGAEAHAVAQQRMAWLNDELSGREFIATEDYTVADITAQSALILGKNTGAPIPDDCGNLQRWFENVSARPTARA